LHTYFNSSGSKGSPTPFHLSWLALQEIRKNADVVRLHFIKMLFSLFTVQKQLIMSLEIIRNYFFIFYLE